MKMFFLPTVSFLAIGALVFRWTKASVTFVCKSCLTGAIMLAGVCPQVFWCENEV